MNCEQIDEIKKAFMNGEVSGEQARAVRLHLASCAACASHLSPAEWVEILPAIDKEIEPTRDFSERFYARLEARQNENALPIRTKAFLWFSLVTWGWSHRLAAAGAFTALIVVGIFIGQYLSESPDRPFLYGELSIVENMDLLQDMAVINNLELLENFDAIESLASDAEILDRQRSTP
jgi:anti-sigma factor RsiW